jgi:hypothetical protein
MIGWRRKSLSVWYKGLKGRGCGPRVMNNENHFILTVLSYSICRVNYWDPPHPQTEKE